MKYNAILATLALPLMSCLSQVGPKAAQGFEGVGLGPVRDSFGLQIQGGYYQAEPMIGSNSVGLYGGLGLSNPSLLWEAEDDFLGGSRVDEEVGAWWASLGATYRLTDRFGLRVGVTAASITTYGVYDNYFLLEESIVEEESGSTIGGEVGVDFIPEGESGKAVGAAPTTPPRLMPG